VLLSKLIILWGKIEAGEVKEITSHCLILLIRNHDDFFDIWISYHIINSGQILRWKQKVLRLFGSDLFANLGYRVVSSSFNNKFLVLVLIIHIVGVFIAKIEPLGLSLTH
jgi:hypothetical protein